MDKKLIIFTGGGSGGHVMPALTLIHSLKDFDVEYIGGKNSIEKELVPSHVRHYYPIFTGKLRRYLSLENFFDIFKVFLGLCQSFMILLFKPGNTIVFSTGGFVSVPVVLAAWLTGKKIFIHEQTARVGLANKIASKFADKVFVSFSDSLNYFPKNKTILSGYPLREHCFSDEQTPFLFQGIDLNKQSMPVLFITGGGNGSKLLNDLIKDSLDEFSKKYFIVHQVGKQFEDEYKSLESDTYKPVAFVKDEMISLMKNSDIVISRAGAGTVSELMAIKKPSVFVPLKIAQKNEQFHNAKEAKDKIGSIIIEEDELRNLSLKEVIDRFQNRPMKDSNDYKALNGTAFLVNAIESL